MTSSSTMGDVYVRTRSYQLEMFERSTAENIIVAVGLVSTLTTHTEWRCQMDTGSGKTHMYGI